jgi:hypothetical protein
MNYKIFIFPLVFGATLWASGVTAAVAAGLPDAVAETPAFLQAVTQRLCPVAGPDPAEIARQLPGVSVGAVKAMAIGGKTIGWRATVRLAEGELRIRQQSGRTFAVEFYRTIDKGALRPEMTARADRDCRIVNGRWLRYDASGRRDVLEHYGPDLADVERVEPLNPPMPAGRSRSGVLVALFDAGLNYTLPEFSTRLARAPNGRPLGFDFWEMDARPYDGNPARSPFYPIRHGTPVASVLVREAPAVRLLPYRYPRPDMRRMGNMVRAADANGARIVSMPMGSNRRDHWETFLAAARERPHMLFIVSAGNDGRNIDDVPVFPASASLDNKIVVTSSTAFGRLAQGSNWGPQSVDIMVPAENVDVIDFRGAAGKASGSSYAVPRVAALAARLSRRHPQWTASDLKRAILDRARPSPYQRRPAVRYGWIANPADDG